jgi:hypothetical protein
VAGGENIEYTLHLHQQEVPRAAANHSGRLVAFQQEESTNCMILGDEAANEGRTRCPAVRRRYLLARCVMQDRANDQVSGRNSIVATQLPTYNDWSRNVTRSLVRAGNLFRHSSTAFWKLLSPDTYLYT